MARTTEPIGNVTISILLIPQWADVDNNFVPVMKALAQW